MRNIKKNELKREMLLAGEGFCKKMSMKELYAESPVWKYVERLGILLTRNWPADKDGHKYWNPSYDLMRIRYQCIRVLYCKDEKTFDGLFDYLSTAAFIVLRIGSLPTLYLNIFLSWVALKFVKNPSCFVRSYIRVLRNLFFSIDPFMVQYFIDTMGYEEYHQTLLKQGEKITPDDELQIAGVFEWLYKNMQIQEPLIRKYKDQGFYLKVSSEIESPRNMYGSWWKQTKNFNLIRIAELLTLWEKDSDKIAIVNHIKEDYKRWNIDDNDERKIKNKFFEELHQSLKKGDCILFLCRLQEENMKNIITIENLSDENERTKKYYEEEKKQKQELIERRTVVYNNFKHFDAGSICEDHSKHIYLNNKNNSNLNKQQENHE